MEREILVANTRTQQRHKFTADVTTLAELKAVLDEKDIDYSGMSFTEGITNVQLNDDNSQLPHDTLYKGQTTNSLVIILTNTTKNITSGALPSDRSALGQFIKEHNLGKDIIAHFGKNWTQVSTANLHNFMQNFQNQAGTTHSCTPAKEEDDFDDILGAYGMVTSKNRGTTEEPAPQPKDMSEVSKAVKAQQKEDAYNAIMALIEYYTENDILYTSMEYDDLKEYILGAFDC